MATSVDCEAPLQEGYSSDGSTRSGGGSDWAEKQHMLDEHTEWAKPSQIPEKRGHEQLGAWRDAKSQRR